VPGNERERARIFGSQHSGDPTQHRPGSNRSSAGLAADLGIQVKGMLSLSEAGKVGHLFDPYHLFWADRGARLTTDTEPRIKGQRTPLLLPKGVDVTEPNQLTAVFIPQAKSEQFQAGQ